MKFTPRLRGALMIFGSVVLLELLIVGAKLLIKGFQEPLWKDPTILVVPVAMGLLYGVGLGLWRVREAKQSAPGAVTFDKYGFTVVDREGTAFRVSWRLLSRAFLIEHPTWEWRFLLKDRREVVVPSDVYTREQWKDLSGEFTRRLKRRNIDVTVLGAGQLGPESGITDL